MHRYLFAVAAVVGVLHAAASFYWALGGTWLLDTVGQFAVDMQAEGGIEVRLMLFSVGLLKLAGAIIPPLFPANRWIRLISWVGVAVLLLWGGSGMVGGWIAFGSNRTPAILGHAFLWDPLFVVWGLCLGGALLSSRGRRGRAPQAP